MTEQWTAQLVEEVWEAADAGISFTVALGGAGPKGDPGPPGAGASLIARAVLHAPSLAPSTGDTIRQLLWTPGATITDTEALDDGVPSQDWTIGDTWLWGDTWDAAHNADAQVLVMLPGDWRPSSLSAIKDDGTGFEPQDVLGGAEVLVVCGGNYSNSGRASKWVAQNTDSLALVGGLDPATAVDWFEPITIGDRDVIGKSYESGLLASAGVTAGEKFDAINNLTLGGAGPDHAGFRIDDCAVDGTATSVQLLDDYGQPLGPPTGIIAGLRVFMVDVSGKTGYVTTASGAWTAVSSNAGETWLNLNPGTGGWYQGTNTAGFGGSVDDDAAATSIVILAPGVVTPADIDPFQFPALTPSVPVVLSAEEDIFSGTGDTLTLVANPPLVTRNADRDTPVGGESDDRLIYDGNPLYPLRTGDVVIIRGGSHEGGWKLTGGEVGDEAVRLTDDDNVQGVLWGRLLHNRLIKVAEGPRGQRLAVVFAGDGLHSAREFAWLTANDITAPTTIELTRTHGKGEHDELVIALAGLGDFADAGGDAGKVLIVNDAGDGFELVTGGVGGGVHSVTVTAGVELSGTETDPVIGLDWPVVRATAGRPALVYPDDLGKHLIATSDGEGNAVPWWADPEVPDSSAQPSTAYLQPDGDGGAQWGPALDDTFDPLGAAQAVADGLGTAAARDVGTGSTQLPTTSDVDSRIQAVVGVAPSTLDTLAEIATALLADESTAAALATTVGTKMAKSANGSDIVNPATFRTNLGVAIGSDVQGWSAQLDALAALSGTTFGRGFLTLADHAALMTKLALVAADIPTIAESQVTNLTTDLAAKVPNTRTVAGLDLSADRSASALRTALGLTAFATLATGTAGYVVGADATTFALGGVPLGTPSGGSQNYGVPGVAWSGVTANTAAANTISYLPFIVTAPITVDRLVFECTTLNSGKSVVMGIYAATTAWQPTGAALADTGAVSVTTTGVKASTVSAALAPGRYLLAFLNEHASTGVRFAVPTMPTVCEIDAATMGGTNNIVTTYRLASLTFATSLPNTGPAWTSTKGASPSVFPMILMRWSLT